MTRRRPEIPTPDVLLIQSFEVKGFAEGKFLPLDIGPAILLEVDGISIAGISHKKRITADCETMIEIAKRLVEIATVLGTKLEA